MRFLLDFFKGILIGSGAILPGISSGVFCVVFGIYEKLVDSILNIFHDFKKNFTFLFPIALGGIVGVLLVSKLLKFLLTMYPVPTNFCFIGLILGSLPVLFKKANKSTGFRLHYLIYFFFTLLLGILSIKLEYILPQLINLDLGQNYFFYLILAGFLMSVGIVVPGVSSSLILMSLGVYSIYIASVASIDLSVLFPMGIGLILGCILFLKIIQFLLNKYYSQTFYSIIGFVLGSILILYPGFNFNFEGLISVMLFLVSFFISFSLEKIEGKKKVSY